MTKPTNHFDYEAGQRCSVADCDRSAEYEVYLYDYYPTQDEEFFEQDFTCPFLCEMHMEKNEREACGDRKPRGYVDYPFSNGHHAQGYTKYTPLSGVYPKNCTKNWGQVLQSSIHEVDSKTREQ